MHERPETPIALLLHLAGGRAPRLLRARFGQATRDVSVLENRILLGRAPSPLVDRGPRRPRAEVARTLPVVVAEAPRVAARADEIALVTVLDGATRTTCSPTGDQYVLHAALEAGANMPFSCALGGCGSCKVKLVAGEYTMDEPHCLTPEERDAGWVLTCVGRATSPCTLEIAR